MVLTRTPSLVLLESLAVLGPISAPGTGLRQGSFGYGPSGARILHLGPTF